jgi:antitoxin component YwqK of YwqJK toxin-antitoxin module
MRKEQLDNWIENGGKLPENLTENEKRYLMDLGYDYVPVENHEGELVEEYHYLNGKKHGRYSSWYQDGRLWIEEYWFKGKEHGLCVEYDWCDNIVRKQEYAYGVFLKDFLK